MIYSVKVRGVCSDIKCEGQRGLYSDVQCVRFRGVCCDVQCEGQRGL